MPAAAEPHAYSESARSLTGRVLSASEERYPVQPPRQPDQRPAYVCPPVLSDSHKTQREPRTARSPFWQKDSHARFWKYPRDKYR